MQKLLLADLQLHLPSCCRLCCLQQLWRSWSKSQLSLTYLPTFLSGTGLNVHLLVMSMKGAPYQAGLIESHTQVTQCGQ